MQVQRLYRFEVGTKIPFHKWNEIIEEYLRSQGLSHGSFYYYMENYDRLEEYRAILDGTKCEDCHRLLIECDDCRERARKSLEKGTGCERAVKEHPFLGQIHERETRYTKIQSLHNFKDGSNHTKDRIYPILTKLHRRYGFTRMDLVYGDVDFFSQKETVPALEERRGEFGYEGSWIRLCRSCFSTEHTIILSVASPCLPELPDPAPYVQAMAALLPGIKEKNSLRICLTEEEAAQYEQLHQQAGPFLVQAKDFFCQQMPEEKGNDQPEGKVSVATCLKKFGKAYGYTYCGFRNRVYIMEKRLTRGHFIYLEFVSNPHCPSADPVVSLRGLNFDHPIWGDGFAPQNPTDAAWYFTKLFDTLAQAEEGLFPAILNLYPPTPQWYSPIDG
ncbi:MAG: hypothetical protein J6K89_04545 [Oscillospiraceae bacterium]|nr:hypothetical protein [Oscillospiraceae bacterium]